MRSATGSASSPKKSAKTHVEDAELEIDAPLRRAAREPLEAGDEGVGGPGGSFTDRCYCGDGFGSSP